MLSDGEHNLADTAADSSAVAAPTKLPQGGAVEACSEAESEGAPVFAPAFPTESRASSGSSSSHPTSDFPHPTSAAPPRRAVPLTFNPIINDEANILAAITRGDRTLFELAEEHETTVTNLCIWLQREDIQQKLNDLSTCGAQITRVAAVNQLPKAVKAMAFQIETHIFDRTHNLIKPGLAADKISALRDANARKACNLLLRVARFDPSQPLYRKRIDDNRSAAAPSVASASLPFTSDIRHPTSDIGVGAPAFSTESPSAFLPSPSPQPDLLSLCAAALSAANRTHEPRVPQNPDPETRSPEPDFSARSFTSHIPLPTSDMALVAHRATGRRHGSASRSDAQPAENHRLNTSAPWADEAGLATSSANARPPPN